MSSTPKGPNKQATKVANRVTPGFFTKGLAGLSGVLAGTLSAVGRGLGYSLYYGARNGGEFFLKIWETVPWYTGAPIVAFLVGSAVGVIGGAFKGLYEGGKVGFNWAYQGVLNNILPEAPSANTSSQLSSSHKLEQPSSASQAELRKPLPTALSTSPLLTPMADASRQASKNSISTEANTIVHEKFLEFRERASKAGWSKGCAVSYNSGRLYLSGENPRNVCEAAQAWVNFQAARSPPASSTQHLTAFKISGTDWAKVEGLLKEAQRQHLTINTITVGTETFKTAEDFQQAFKKKAPVVDQSSLPPDISKRRTLS